MKKVLDSSNFSDQLVGRLLAKAREGCKLTPKEVEIIEEEVFEHED